MTRSLFRCLLFLCLAAPLAHAQNDAENSPVAVLGLGVMGKALTSCFSSQGYEVHVWNRGAERREQVREMNLPRVTVHNDAQDAVAATDTIIIMFASEPELKSVLEFVESIPKNKWKGKTIVNFASQEPFAVKVLEEKLKGYNVNHVGGAMIAVPETICSPGSIVLTSAPDRSAKAFEEVTPALEVLGRLETFSGDVGYGSLIDIGLLQTLYFGLTGYELSLLFLEKYGVPEDIMDRYVTLCKEIFPIYFPHFFGVAANSIIGRNFDVGYLTAKANKASLEMHSSFLKKIGITDDNFNNLYLKFTEKTVEAEPGTSSSSVVKHYSVDGFTYDEKKDEL